MTLTSLSYCYEEQAKASTTERSMLSRYRHDFVSSGRNYFGLASCVRSLTGQRWGTAARYQSPCYSWWQLTGASLWCYSSWVRLHGRWTWHGIWRTSIPSLGSPAFTSLRPLELGLAALSDSVRTPVTWGIVYIIWGPMSSGIRLASSFLQWTLPLIAAAGFTHCSNRLQHNIIQTALQPMDSNQYATRYSRQYQGHPWRECFHESQANGIQSLFGSVIHDGDGNHYFCYIHSAPMTLLIDAESLAQKPPRHGYTWNRELRLKWSILQVSIINLRWETQFIQSLVGSRDIFSGELHRNWLCSKGGWFVESDKWKLSDQITVTEGYDFVGLRRLDS